MKIKSINLFSIYLLSLPLLNFTFVPGGFIRPLFSYLSLPIIFVNIFLKRKINNNLIIFLFCSLIFLTYSILISIFFTKSSFLLSSLNQYIFLIINFFGLYLIFSNLSRDKIFIFFLISIFYLLLNSIVIVFQSSSDNFISGFFVKLINSISQSKFYLKPSGIFPEASVGAFYLMVSSIPLLEGILYLKSKCKNIKKIFNINISFIITISMLSGFFTLSSNSRTYLLGLAVLFFCRISSYLRLKSFSLRALIIGISTLLGSLLITINFVIPKLDNIFSLNYSIIAANVSNITRFSLIYASLKASLTNPFGLGLGGFKTYFSEYLPDWSTFSGEINVALGDSFAKYGIISPDFVIDSKNYLGTFLTDFGIPLTGIIIYFILYNLRIIFKFKRFLPKNLKNLSSHQYSDFLIFRYLENVFILLPVIFISSSSLVIPFLPIPFVLLLVLKEKFKIIYQT